MPLIERAGRSFLQRDFRWMFSGALLSTGMQWLQSTALGWLTYHLTGSGTLVGLVLGARAIPIMLISPLSGVAADRYDRRRALALTQIFVALPAFFVSAALVLNAVAVWQLFLFTILSGITSTFDRTLRNSLVFDILPREDLSNGLALINVAFSLSRSFGPPIAGALIAYTGPAWCFAIQGLLALGVTASVLCVRPRPHRSTSLQRASAWSEMKSGLAFALRHPVIRMMLMMNALTGGLLIATFAALLPIFAADIYQVGAQGLGIMMGAAGLGSIVGSAIAASNTRVDRIGLMQTIAMVLFAASLIAFAFVPPMPVALFFLASAGAAELVLIVSASTVTQLSAPEAMRGRVTALLPLFSAFISLGSFLAGICSDLIGPSSTSMLFSGMAAAIVLTAWLCSPALRTLRLSRLVAGRASGSPD